MNSFSENKPIIATTIFDSPNLQTGDRRFEATRSKIRGNAAVGGV
jgi:hypothetical protein